MFVRSVKKNPSAQERQVETERIFLNFNMAQLRMHFGNIFRIEYVQFSRPAIKAFLEKYDSRRCSQRTVFTESAKENRDKPEAEEKGEKNGQKQAETHKEEPAPNKGEQPGEDEQTRGAEPRAPGQRVEVYEIEDQSIQDNNLFEKLSQSVNRCESMRKVTDFLNTRKRIFEQSIQGKSGISSPVLLESKFTSPELIDNGVFKNIELTTIKKRNFRRRANSKRMLASGTRRRRTWGGR